MNRSVYILLTVLSLVFFTGCVKAPQESDTTPPAKFEDLYVPAAFDWETSRDVEFRITAENSTVITITSEDGSIQYHKGFYSQLPAAYVIKVNLPSYVQKVQVNGRLISITGTILTISLPGNTLNVLKSLSSSQPVSFSNLIAAWHFDENAGSVASDLLGLHNGTITGSRWAPGISGSALELDGATGQVLVPNNAGFNPVSNKISFSFWFKLSEVGIGGTFIYQNVKYLLRVDTQGRVSFALYTPVWKSLVMDYGDRILDTDWHHVVATYDGATMKIYLDKMLKASCANTGTLQSATSDVIIGKQGTINPFKGIIDEMLVYSIPLTENEIEQIYTTTPNPGNGAESLISSWSFDENSGTIAADSHGTNPGTVSNATWGTGITGHCVECNGTSSNVNIVNTLSLNPVNAITMMAWVKAREHKSGKIFQKGDWDGHGLGQDIWEGWQASIRMSDNTSQSLTWGGGRPILNEWYHLALTYDGNTLNFYVNGQLRNSKTITGVLKLNSRNLSIGSDNAIQKFFNGSIDEVKIYGAALSQTEIQTHVNDQSITTDKDGDGVPDNNDSYPNDPARAFNNFYPAEGFGSLAFEDLWPNKGDYDFNDLVVDYQFTIVTNANNKVTEVLSAFVIRAIGASFANGFGFQFPGTAINASNIQVEGSKLFENYITLNQNGTEANQDKTTIIVFDNAQKIMPTPSGYANVQPGSPYITPDTLMVNIGFKPNIYGIGDLDLNNFNPFLMVNKERGKEIHLPNYPPTSLINQAYLGTGQDQSNLSTGVYYKTATNLPWAIKLASSFDCATEETLVTTAYLKFTSWAESSGQLFPDWYLNKTGYRNESYIYQIP